MKEEKLSLKKILQPYLFISVAGLLAFAPVSFMLRALKNDIIALEYPINHFMSQSIHNGEIPYWFNTWGMGFPLQSNLTWGIFSTPQMLFSSLFNYNIYTLHIEFMFFVLLAGWGMFHLLQKHILKDQKLSQLLAICYMLSGFMVGSTQWLLYITAAAFIPLVVSCLLSLLQTPSIKNSFQFSVVYTLMFTSVYAAFNIITTYSLIVFIILWFLLFEKERKKRISTVKHVALAGFLVALLCFPSLHFTLELLNHIDRGSSITGDSGFFNSNYLHPAALSNLLLPFSSVKMHFSNTEGTMLNTYAGLFLLLTLPISIWWSFKNRNKPALLLLFAALLFLLFSFGEMTPARNALNILPGFSYFRNPAIFRLYFITSIIIFTAVIFRNKSFNELFFFKSLERKIIIRVVWILLTVCLVTLIANLNAFNNFSFYDLPAFIKNINYGETLVISGFIQIFILAIILVLLKLKKSNILPYILAFDLIVNTLICTPFYSVSSYSITEVNAILNPVKGFPLQSKKPDEVAATFTDSKKNTWYNVNIFSKEVSTKDSYRGPLMLSNFKVDSSGIQHNTATPLLFANIDSINSSIQLLIQRPTHIRASVDFATSASITLMQNYYKGWKAFYNDQEVEINNTSKPGISISIPKGKGIIDFKYERKNVWLSALLLHFIVIIFLIGKGVTLIRKYIIKSPSLSSPY